MSSSQSLTISLIKVILYRIVEIGTMSTVTTSPGVTFF